MIDQKLLVSGRHIHTFFAADNSQLFLRPKLKPRMDLNLDTAPGNFYFIQVHQALRGKPSS